MIATGIAFAIFWVIFALNVKHFHDRVTVIEESIINLYEMEIKRREKEAQRQAREDSARKSLDEAFKK